MICAGGAALRHVLRLLHECAGAGFHLGNGVGLHNALERGNAAALERMSGYSGKLQLHAELVNIYADIAHGIRRQLAAVRIGENAVEQLLCVGGITQLHRRFKGREHFKDFVGQLLRERAELSEVRHRMVGREDGEAHRLRGFIGGIGKTDGIVIAVGNTDKQQKMCQTADNIHRFPA